MAKSKPELTNDVPEAARAFAEEPLREAIRGRKVEVEEVKRQVPLRLTPSVIQRITILAGHKTVSAGKRVTNQDLLEGAVLAFLKREEAALKRDSRRGNDEGKEP